MRRRQPSYRSFFLLPVFVDSDLAPVSWSSLCHISCFLSKTLGQNNTAMAQEDRETDGRKKKKAYSLSKTIPHRFFRFDSQVTRSLIAVPEFILCSYAKMKTITSEESRLERRLIIADRYQKHNRFQDHKKFDLTATQLQNIGFSKQVKVFIFYSL